MSNEDDVRRAQAGRECWNKWAVEHCNNGTSPDVDFSRAGLTNISFEGFIFPGKANFSWAAFREEVSFDNAEFRDEACFTRARFQGNALFRNAKFFGPAKVDRIRFFKDANFCNVHFYDEAYMAFNRFKGWWANFENAVFDGRLDLTHAKFNSETVFDSATFDEADFTGITTTHNLVRFKNTSFSTAPDFRASKFQVPPNLEGMRVKYQVAADNERSAFHQMLHQVGQRARGSEDAAKFRRLKEMANDSAHHERGLYFFARELKAKRFYETRGFGPIMLNMAFEFLSNFGRSVERPIFFLLLLICLGAAAVLLEHPPPSPAAGIALGGFALASLICRLCRTACFLSYLIAIVGGLLLLTWTPLAVMASLSNSVPLLGGSTLSGSCRALAALANECEFRLVPFIVSGLQGGLTVLLLFLIGLGLRNRFRIGGS